MILKATVLALMTIFALAGPSDYNPRNPTNNNGNMNNPNNPYNNMDEEVAGLIVFIYMCVFIVVAGINIFLCTKCLKKRTASKVVKDQMTMKKMEFATMHGLNLQQLNDPR